MSTVPPFFRVNDFMKTSEGADMIFENGSFYQFHKTHYVKRHISKLKKMLVDFLIQQEHYKEISDFYIKNMLLILEAKCSIHNQTGEVNYWKTPINESHYTVSCSSGNICIEQKGEFIVETPHNKNYVAKSIIPHRYNENAECSEFLKFLESSIPDPLARQLTQEFAGYCLTYCTKMEAMLFAYGTGGNGKTITLEVMKQLLGKDNYSVVPMSDFYNGSRFSLVRTKGKMVNFCDEVPEDKKIKGDRIKAIVSGAEVIVEEKGQPTHSCRSSIKLYVSCNDLLNTGGNSKALDRRTYGVVYPNDFSSPELQRKEYTQKRFWESEMEGIFLWALRGLQSLLRRGHFVEPPSSKELKLRHNLEQNSEFMFLSENIEYTKKPEDLISSAALYLMYRKFCSGNGITPCSNVKLGKEVRLRFSFIEQTGPIKDDDLKVKSRKWIGLALIRDAPPGSKSEPDKLDDKPPYENHSIPKDTVGSSHSSEYKEGSDE